MKIKNIEFGLIRNNDGKLSFHLPEIDRNCEEGCIIFTLGCFYVTVLKGGCAAENF